MLGLFVSLTAVVLSPASLRHAVAPQRAAIVAAAVPPLPAAGDADLLERANEFLHSGSGFYTPPREELFSDEFIFRGPAIGPLNRADYLQILGTFGIYTAFPDIKPNAFGFTVDPEDPSRVWFLVRNSGTNTGPLGLGLGLSWPASGNAVEGAPETFSIKFDADGRVKLLTVGYVADRFEGNTGGSGAALGLMKVAGLVPLGFSASNPLFQLAQKFGDAVNYPARTMSRPEDVPRWWTAEERGAEGC